MPRRLRPKPIQFTSPTVVSGIVTLAGLTNNLIVISDNGDAIELYDQQFAQGRHRVLTTSNAGISLSPESGGNTSLSFFASDLTTLRANLVSGSIDRWTSFTNSNTIQIRARDAGSGFRTNFVMDPDGSTTLGYAAVPIRVHTDSQGVVIRRDGDTDAEISRLKFQFQNATDRASIGFDANDAFRMRNIVTGGNITLEARDASVTNVSILVGDPDGATDLYSEGGRVVRVLAEGVTIEGTACSIFHDGIEAVNYTARNTEGGIRWRIDGGASALFITNNSGADINQVMNYAKNGGVTLYWDDILRLETTDLGVDISNPTAAQATSLDVIGSSTDQDAFIRARGDTGGMQMRWRESLSQAFIQQTAGSGSAEDVWINMLVDGQVRLYFNGTREFETKFEGVVVENELEIEGALNHDGTTIGFYGTTPIVKQTSVVVDAAGIHAALVNLGLIT